ncbi:MAG TPA: glycine cleavage system aminomethyltransferase GcvT [Burkholderiales bacterium]|nr:glycine cleavage system aminomethyltransferase GcvT [Burkholderiales bacterium]
MASETALLDTPLRGLHVELGAKMVAFAGYAMPVSYSTGIIAEHRHCRAAAALFDVSHMGQLRVTGADAAGALESLMPADIVDLGVNRQRYGFFTNASGGILDDLMVTRREDDIFIVVNASCKSADIAHLTACIGQRCSVEALPQLALLALQGPQAAVALSRLNAAVGKLAFMTGMRARLNSSDCFVTRSGYTGEDGFEISVEAPAAQTLARVLLAQPEVKPAGLGARDTLRLEAGLCLYGHDIDQTITPVEAGLTWAVAKVRRAGGVRAGGYPGATVLENQIARGCAVKRVGLTGSQRIPVREGAIITDLQGGKLGKVTSGTLSPSLNYPIAMGYVATDKANVGQNLFSEVRGKIQPMGVTTMPFVPHRYHRV